MIFTAGVDTNITRGVDAVGPVAGVKVPVRGNGGCYVGYPSGALCRGVQLAPSRVVEHLNAVEVGVSEELSHDRRLVPVLVWAGLSDTYYSVAAASTGDVVIGALTSVYSCISLFSRDHRLLAAV